MRLFLIILQAALLVGCASGAAYRQPSVEECMSGRLGNWWQVFPCSQLGTGAM